MILLVKNGGVKKTQITASSHEQGSKSVHVERMTR